MAKKQIMISQYDFGHMLRIKMIKGNGEDLPLDIEAEVEVSLTKPDNSCVTVEKKHYSFIKSLNTVSFVLPVEYTQEAGLYTIYVTLRDTINSYRYTSETAISYFVTERHNGANCTH